MLRANREPKPPASDRRRFLRHVGTLSLATFTAGLAIRHNADSKDGTGTTVVPAYPPAGYVDGMAGV